MTANPNDAFVTTHKYPQNYILRNDVEHFPKIKALIDAKNQRVDTHVLHEPLFIVGDLREMNLASELGTKFESILIDPPWFEYHARAGGFPPTCKHRGEDTTPWTFEEIMNLRIGDIAADQSFSFLWCGNKHVQQGTECLLRWGFKRIEDICWVKTNESNTHLHPRCNFLPYGVTEVLYTTKEHLLVGIKGTVSRSMDNYLIHANVDSDVMIAEQAPFGCMMKPQETYRMIERFCNSQRRLELFGSDHNLRPGWVTVGKDIMTGPSNYVPQTYIDLTRIEQRFVPTNDLIEKLRPRSPVNRSRTPTPPG